jgi:hypothetical protein
MDNKKKDQIIYGDEAVEHDWMEAELQRWGSEAGKIDIPAEVDDALRSGVSTPIRNKRSSMFRKGSYVAAVAVLFVLILVTASVSPVFAAALNHIPGISNILKLIGSDPGLQGAIDRDYMQPVGLSDTHNGITFTVDGIVTDSVRVNVFYSLRMETHQATPYFGSMNVLDADTQQKIKAFYGFKAAEADKAGLYRGVIDIQMAEGVPVPKNLKVEFSPDQNGSMWKVVFPVDKSKSEGKQEFIDVHKEVTVSGQKLRIERVNIYPTRLTLDISFDSSNSKRIFNLSEMTIVNEKGEVLQNKSAVLGESGQTIHFDSSYFSKPKSLTLKVGRIMALDKDKLTMKLDLNKKKILQAPDDKVTVTSVQRRTDGGYVVDLRLQSPNIERYHFGYTLVGKLIDANGKEYKTGQIRSGTDGSSDKISTQIEILSDNSLQNPVSIHLSDYPSWIEEPFEVKLK